MNRDIKFRAWSSEEEKMCKWEDMLSGYTLSWCYHNQYWKLMQYTGLKDKNGKEIYEGDILSYKSSHTKHEGKVFNNVVEFATGQSLCGWRMRNKSCIVKATPYKFVSSEIIGNIYENPELLDTKKAQLSEPNVEK